MNITYLIGTLFAVGFMVIGMMLDGSNLVPTQIMRFFDPASIMITVGCTFAVIIASFPVHMLKSIPKHLAILMNTKKFDPMLIVEQLVDLAQIARKNGLLALEEKANSQEDPFFKQAIMLIVDANDPDKVRGILENDIECMSSRHEDVAAMYDRASSAAPAFGMVGTLVGLINMLKAMDTEAGTAGIGPAMGTALITTLYGCILAHIVFNPIACHLRTRDEEEVLCRMIIVEGITSIQSGENPKFLREKLLTFLSQNSRGEEGGSKRKGRSKKNSSGEE